VDREPKRVEQRDDDGRHDGRLSENARNLNRRNAYGVFGRHRYAEPQQMPGQAAKRGDDAKRRSLDRLDAFLDLDTHDRHAHRVTGLRGVVDKAHATHLRFVLPFKLAWLQARAIMALRRVASTATSIFSRLRRHPLIASQAVEPRRRVRESSSSDERGLPDGPTRSRLRPLRRMFRYNASSFKDEPRRVFEGCGLTRQIKDRGTAVECCLNCSHREIWSQENCSRAKHEHSTDP
jgi:hypothetical protein